MREIKEIQVFRNADGSVDTVTDEKGVELTQEELGYLENLIGKIE